MPTQRGDSGSSSLHGADHAEQHLTATATAMRSVLEGAEPVATSNALTTSAVGALFQRRLKTSAEGHEQQDPSQTESPSLHHPVTEAASRTGISGSTTTSSLASPKAVAAARPIHLPPLIEMLVGAVDSDATLHDLQDDVHKLRQNLTRPAKVDEQRAWQASIDSAIEGGDATTKAAAAAAATFRSSLQSRSHTLLARPSRMRAVNEEWGAALRWIAGWSSEELTADADAVAAAKAKKADALKRRGRIQSRKASRSGQSAAKWDLVERLTAEEASELLLLIDVCVDRCADIMTEDSAWGGPKDRTPVASKNIGNAVTDMRSSRRGSLLLTFMSSVLPGECSSQALVTGVVGLLFSSALAFLLHPGYGFTLLWKEKKEPASAWGGNDKEHDERIATPSRKSGGKKGKRRTRRQPKSSPVDESARQDQDKTATPSDREEALGAQTVQLSKSSSQTSLSDDDDAILVGLIRNANRSDTSTSSDASVRATRHNSTGTGTHTHLAAPQCDMSGQGPKPTRQQTAKNRTTKWRQRKFPIPTETQRNASHQQLREFQRIQLAKHFQMKEEAKHAAERAAAVRKKTSIGVSYSSVASSSSSPPLSPPRLTPQASVVGKKHKEPRSEVKDVETDNAFSSYATSPRSNIATPCRDLVSDNPLDDVACEILISSLSGMLDEEDNEYRHGKKDAHASTSGTGNAGVSPPPGFAYASSSSNFTTHPTGTGDYRDSPQSSSSPTVGALNIARVASTWSSGSQSDIW